MGRFADGAGDVLKESGLTGTIQPGFPVGGVFGLDVKFLAPTVQVESELSTEVFVSDGEKGVVGDVGSGARVGVEVGLLGHAGGGGVLLDVEQGFAVLGWSGDVLGVKMVTPEMTFGALQTVEVAGVLAL